MLAKQMPGISEQDPVYLLALERASKLKGGTEKLATYLGVPVSNVRIWEQGLAPVPAEVFLKIVDVLYSDPPG